MLTVRNFLRFIVDFYPETLRSDLERELPALTLTVSRLALEVMDSETKGIRYSDAVRDPSFPFMGRVHFGVSDTLKWRVPIELISALNELLQRAAEGDFEPLRQLAFALAARRHDPEAALFRFLIWQGIRLNLLVQTWDDPIIEAAGVLWSAEAAAEDELIHFLRVPEMLDEHIRPLNVLVAAAAEHLELAIGRFKQEFSRNSALLEQLIAREKLLGVVRSLDARSAAALWPGESYDVTGSQRIADRYPQHFPSANAVEAQRARTLRRFEAAGLPAPEGNRIIDLVRKFEQDAL